MMTRLAAILMALAFGVAGAEPVEVTVRSAGNGDEITAGTRALKSAQFLAVGKACVEFLAQKKGPAACLIEAELKSRAATFILRTKGEPTYDATQQVARLTLQATVDVDLFKARWDTLAAQLARRPPPTLRLSVRATRDGKPLPAEMVAAQMQRIMLEGGVTVLAAPGGGVQRVRPDLMVSVRLTMTSAGARKDGARVRWTHQTRHDMRATELATGRVFVALAGSERVESVGRTAGDAAMRAAMLRAIVMAHELRTELMRRWTFTATGAAGLVIEARGTPTQVKAFRAWLTAQPWVGGVSARLGTAESTILDLRTTITRMDLIAEKVYRAGAAEVISLDRTRLTVQLK